MQTPDDHHVYKYFAPEDRFLRIRAAGRATLRWTGSEPPDPATLDGAGYRRLVVEQAVPEVDPAELADDDRVAELFRLVLDVNPELDLGLVRLGGSPALHTSEPTDARAAGADDFRGRLRRLGRDAETRLARRVLGQDRALLALGRTVRRAAMGWEQRGPLGTLLFLGPTGTGKTELAKALAAELGDESALVRVDCTEFGEGHEYAKLIGSPPGYVGHDDGGFLSRALERTPRAVVLFDEVEKAHERLHHLLLQVLDEGHLTDGRGVRLDLTQCFVVLTSNAGTSELARAKDGLGFGARTLGDAARDEVVRSALADRFRPEFLARLDEVVLFDDVDAATAARIAEVHLTELAVRARRAGQRVRFSSAVARWVADRGLTAGEGARGLLHVLRREVEAPIAELCQGERSPWIRVSVRAGRLRFARAA